jgi:hypothetical protein
MAVVVMAVILRKTEATEESQRRSAITIPALNGRALNPSALVKPT